ncbi:Glycogen debranching enzyme [Rhizoctonia solani]|uniref:Glycogen debranching enzyme n=1 Tax=Rhizoctonia solani TaxID=456999 RepID=A0A0K6G350_9AGAM|nr:Glycogen debranching enzyme [Rhizoctonia solani]
MSNNIARPIHTSIQEWEEAGRSLSTAATRYLELSLTLGQKASLGNVSPTHLATWIDSSICSLRVDIAHKVSQAQSTLARERNRILSPISQFPEEILSEIFGHVITAPPSLTGEHQNIMEQGLVNMYRRLHTLLEVCSVWRKIALNRSRFWSFIPIVNTLSRNRLWQTAQYTRIIQSHLKRAGMGGLHLAVTQSCDPRFLSSLGDYASRFRTVNVDAGQSTISAIMDMFFYQRSSEPLTLSQLSLRQMRDNAYFENSANGTEYLFAPSSQEQRSFTQLVKNLCVLRISVAKLHWDQILFSHRLVELNVQNVLFGYDSALTVFFNALSSATELRDLKLMSIRTLYDLALDTETRLPAVPTVYLPTLQSLTIHNLYYNTLNFFFSSVDPRCLHGLKLVLNDKCHSLHLPESVDALDDDEFDFSTLLGGIPFENVFIDGPRGNNDHWLLPSELGSLMNSVSTLKVLHLHSLNLDEEYCEAMKNPNHPQDSNFARLTELYLTWISIPDKAAFKAMITSHSGSLRYLEMGGDARDSPEGPRTGLEEDEEFIAWLKDNVPKFRLREERYYPPQCREPEWQLW